MRRTTIQCQAIRATRRTSPAYFENDRFSVRLSYNYRSEYFIDNDRGRELYSDATDSLDLSINVNVTDYLALTFDAREPAG